MTETDLRADLAADLDGTFERLVLGYQARLYSFALRVTGDHQDAEEVAQDTFVKAYRALQRYPPDRVHSLLLTPWLYRIALNTARNRARRRGHWAVRLDGEIDRTGSNPGAPDLARGESELADDERNGPEAQTLAAEQRDELAALIATLPERYRVAVLLRHVYGLSYPELATALDQPVGTVKANVHRGIRALREMLGPRAPSSAAEHLAATERG